VVSLPLPDTPIIATSPVDEPEIRSIAIDIENLTRSFNGESAVRDLSLQIFTGEVFGLLGHNGAGKTTTIRMITGLIAPTAGRSTILGLDSRTQGQQIRARTGVLTETPALDSRLTGRENLQFFADFFGIERSRARKRIDFLIDAFELHDREHERVAAYSRGMHQRLALARAMLHDPELLLLDEPTPGLDPVAMRVVHLMIRAFRSDGGTVLLCTHNLEEAERLCDRVAVLEQGQLIALGNPDELTAMIADQQIEIEIAPELRDEAQRAILSVVPDATVAAAGKLVRIDGAPREQIPEIVAALTRAGVPMFRLTPRVSTLEDVYFALHESSRLR
jgi:ABC-2 type transport system ATP-binding protein